MYVNRLNLNNYRNYNKDEISFGDGINIIYGDNAQGKTNILEAIYFFTTGKAYRTNKIKEVIRFGEEFARIKISFENKDGTNNGEVIITQDQKKRIKINDVPINKIGELMGFFNAVIFSPEDLDLVKKGPSERRRFIDICLSQVRPNYFYNLQKYNKILNQRNSLLKAIGTKKSLKDTLSVWDEELVECGSKIIISRIFFIEKIKQLAKEIHSNITNGKEILEIYYKTSIGIDDEVKEIEKVKEIFFNRLKRNKEREIENRISLIGPHRDDIFFHINDIEVKFFGSQGQQRTAVLSLKMAELEYLYEDIGEYPILLLDDVLYELDKSRQEYIMKNIKDKQVIITCTDVKNMDIFKNTCIYKVEKGSISKT